ncbi:MAG: glycosyltransferase [Planctomycetota bacterium]
MHSRPRADAPRSTDLVVPLYRERGGLDRLIRALGAVHGSLPAARVVFVDDGSPDGSGDLAAELAAEGLPPGSWTLLRHRRNLGLSQALATGSLAGRGEAVLWLDADLSYEAEVLPRLVEALADGADLALASPYAPGGGTEGVPPSRLLLSRGLSRAWSMLYRRDLHTWSSMVRAWRRPLLLRCLPSRPRHLGVVESLVRAVQGGARVVEVPAVLRGRREGRSGIRVLPTILGQVAMLAEATTRGLDGPEARA